MIVFKYVISRENKGLWNKAYTDNLNVYTDTLNIQIQAHSLWFLSQINASKMVQKRNFTQDRKQNSLTSICSSLKWAIFTLKNVLDSERVCMCLSRESNGDKKETAFLSHEKIIKV